jgi:RHS repeat-associated protein
MRYASDARLGGQIDSIRVGDAWFGQRIVVSALRWLLASPPLATAWRFGNGLQAQGQYEALKGQQTSFAWRLRGFQDGLHPYTIRSDDSGRVDAASQRERGTLAKNNSWNLMPEAQAAPTSPETLKSSGMIAVVSADTDANKFDAAGRLRSYRSAQGELDLMWNRAGQLVQVSRDGKRVASYAYDGQGRRISKTVDAEHRANRVFIYSGQQLIAEADADGAILKQFIYLGWRPVAWIEPAHTLMQRVKEYLFGPKMVYLHTDHRGAVTAATDSDQRILWESDVDAFGNLPDAANARPAVEQPLRLAGQYADRETGLHYNLARYYDPRSGNFISPDPAGLASGSLDLYAYANGDPLNYFDPDGWAKVVYYAITSKADGKTALGTSQGFTKARWAFVISDIKDGVKENVIYDPTGSFVKSSFATAKRDAFAWKKSEEGYVSDPTLLMQQYYGDSLISLSEFTIDNFDDAKARAILEKLGYAGEKPSCAQAVLPQISFAPGESAIDVINSAANGANKQRILYCPLNQASIMSVKYADDTERDRVEKYEAAAELNETSWLGKDCAQAGCPGIDITGQTGIVYRASYGRSQFTGATFLETINGLTSEEKQALGMTSDMQARITAALKRSIEIGSTTPPGQFSIYRNKYTCATAAGAWDNAGQTAQPPQPAPLTIAERTAFQTNTGLGRQAFIDMVCFAPAGNARPLGEGKNAFMTEAIFTDTTLKSWMMDIFKSDDKFGYISRVLIRNNLRTVLGTAPLAAGFANAETPTLPGGGVNPSYKAKQQSIEEELAMRVSRLHNGGKAAALSENISVLTRTCINTGPDKNTPLCDIGNYVNKFIGITNGHGDWRSLRCAADAKSTGSGNNAKWRGLEFKPLSLPVN